MNPSSMTRVHRFFLHAVQCRLRSLGAIERVQEQPGRGRVLHPALPLSRLQRGPLQQPEQQTKVKHTVTWFFEIADLLFLFESEHDQLF